MPSQTYSELHAGISKEEVVDEARIMCAHSWSPPTPLGCLIKALKGSWGSMVSTVLLATDCSGGLIAQISEPGGRI
jgi:hypothetical protein